MCKEKKETPVSKGYSSKLSPSHSILVKSSSSNSLASSQSTLSSSDSDATDSSNNEKCSLSLTKTHSLFSFFLHQPTKKKVSFSNTPPQIILISNTDDLISEGLVSKLWWSKEELHLFYLECQSELANLLRFYISYYQRNYGITILNNSPEYFSLLNKVKDDLYFKEEQSLAKI